MLCTACGGKDSRGCVACKGTGYLRVEDCPRKVYGDPERRLIQLSQHLSEHHVYPEPGGVLDQTDAFLEAHDLIQHDIAYWLKQDKD